MIFESRIVVYHSILSATQRKPTVEFLSNPFVNWHTHLRGYINPNLLIPSGYEPTGYKKPFPRLHLAELIPSRRDTVSVLSQPLLFG